MFLSYICVWLCLKVCGQAVTTCFCHIYAFGYVLSVWAGCNNMFFVIHMRLAVTCFLSYIRVWLCLKCVGRL